MAKSLSTQNVYTSKLALLQTEVAIKKTKDYFESSLAEALNLTRVSAPILLKSGKGLNDDLNGVERMVSFEALDIKNANIEIVQSLAKWKRMALARYGFDLEAGLYTDMNAIRRDEVLDHLHSIYVDQWDWEKIITKEQRNLQTLKNEVQKIYQVFKNTENYLYELYPVLEPVLPEKIHFITTQELETKYPNLSPKDREDSIAKEFGAVFIMQIGGELHSGEKHDGRSPDYDDWTLNGDIIFWYPLLEQSIEVSSMGIRVDEEALKKQLKISNTEDRMSLEYHQAILNRELPYTIGGGIGQSRICMFFLKKVHIGEVQVSVWNVEIIENCRKENIILL
ncbi:aspartate--ammonia ligase [Neobacillus niacini]|uniref:aspartate--ammonia ligase n=1 Tax=Neobacillus niacini TaxID=86668 RepID=UPI001C8D23CD|nr:aspartate--ammonia ligase [Neobacillus niacini]MBY0147161.1 aspartate--ammonia ligase [Neobacillus niacini]